MKHSILIITYNQEDIIGECLDSVLGQSEMPYEVIVSDDCSTDGTWQVVRRYAERYPDIVKARRNEANMGIFPHVNLMKELPTGDFVNFVSGDDLLPEGILESYSRFIEDHGLDCSKPFYIITDSARMRPSGQMSLKRNCKVLARHPDLFESFLLGSIHTWDTGMSIGLLKAMAPLEIDKGYHADLLWILDRITKAEKYYCLPVQGYIYREGIGVTAGSKKQDLWKSLKLIHEEAMRRYSDRITPKMKRYMCFEEAYLQYLVVSNAANYFAMVRAYFGALPFRKGNIRRGKPRLLIPLGCKRGFKKLKKAIGI